MQGNTKPLQEYKMTLKGLLRFELISLLGRLFLTSRQARLQAGKNYLNLGCGINFIESTQDSATRAQERE